VRWIGGQHAPDVGSKNGYSFHTSLRKHDRLLSLKAQTADAIACTTRTLHGLLLAVAALDLGECSRGRPAMPMVNDRNRRAYVLQGAPTRGCSSPAAVWGAVAHIRAAMFAGISMKSRFWALLNVLTTSGGTAERCVTAK
jgi:hypothetical protein